MIHILKSYYFYYVLLGILMTIVGIYVLFHMTDPLYVIIVMTLLFCGIASIVVHSVNLIDEIQKVKSNGKRN